MKPTISIIHPSRSRPEMACKTATKWLSKAHNTCYIQYVIATDLSDPLFHDYGRYAHEPLKATKGFFITAGSNTYSAIEAINDCAAALPWEHILIVVSDDFDCPINWDVLLLDALEGKEDFVVKTEDGGQPWIMTLPIMDRKYYDRFGYVYHPEYSHMFADTEMTHVGSMLGKTINMPIKFEHRHYTTGAMQKDAINEKNDATWNQGEALYLERLKRNFDLDPKEIVNSASVCHHTHLQWLKSKGVVL